MSTSDELVEQGRRFEAEQHFDSAARCYRLAVKMNPANAAALNALGILSARSGSLSDARRALSRAVTVEPAKPLYRNNLASVLVEEQQYDEALRQLVAANGLQIGRHNLLYLMRVQFEQAGQRDSLIERLMSQQVDDAVYFSPADGEEQADLALPVEERSPPEAQIVEQDSSRAEKSYIGDSAAPNESPPPPPPPDNLIPDVLDSVPRNQIPEASNTVNPLRADPPPPKNELPAEPAANTSASLRLIPAG